MRKAKVVAAVGAVIAFSVGVASAAALHTFTVNNTDGSKITVNCNLPTTVQRTITGKCTWTGNPAPKSTSTTRPTTTTTATTTTTTPIPPQTSFPNAGNTGVPAGTTLTYVPGDDYNPPAGTTRENIETKALYITQPNVVIRNSYIRDSVWVTDTGSLVLENVTIGPVCNPTNRVDTWLAEAIRGSNYVADRVKVQGHEDGPRVGGTGIVVKNSFIDICGRVGAHSDGFQDYPQANGVVIEHNTVDLRNEIGQNAAVNVNAGDQDTACVSNNVKILNNLLIGGAYTMTLCPTNTGWAVSGNRVVDGSSTYGPWSVAHGCKGSWFDNDVVTINQNYEVTSTVVNDKPC